MQSKIIFVCVLFFRSSSSSYSVSSFSRSFFRVFDDGIFGPNLHIHKHRAIDTNWFTIRFIFLFLQTLLRSVVWFCSVCCCAFHSIICRLVRLSSLSCIPFIRNKRILFAVYLRMYCCKLDIDGLQALFVYFNVAFYAHRVFNIQWNGLMVSKFH